MEVFGDIEIKKLRELEEDSFKDKLPFDDIYLSVHNPSSNVLNSIEIPLLSTNLDPSLKTVVYTFKKNE